MRKLISLLTVAILSAVCVSADASKITGRWQFLLEMPHGNSFGALTLQQDGAKLSGTCELQKHGTSTVTGSIDEAKVSMKITLHGGSFTMLGIIKGDQMTGTTEPAGGTWKATRD